MAGLRGHVSTQRKEARVSACCAGLGTHMDDVLQQMDAVLTGHGTVQLHVPDIHIPFRAGGCQLVHRPQLFFF